MVIGGRYRLEQPLARGGLGEVHLGRLVDIEEHRVVLKQIREEVFEQLDATIKRNMFVHEARLGLHLRHPHIAPVIDLVEDNGNLWMVSEYIEGATVQALSTSRRLTVPMCVSLIVQAAKALHYAHNLSLDGEAAHIIHRDCTADNMIVSRVGHLYLIDFGIASSSLPGRRTVTGWTKGKWAYMAPEVLRAHPSSPRSDVWILGVVLRELLTGVKTFAAATAQQAVAKILEFQIPRLKDLAPYLPDDLIALVERAHHPDPAQRVSSARELYRGLLIVCPKAASLETEEALAALVDDVMVAPAADLDCALTERTAPSEEPTHAGFATAPTAAVDDGTPERPDPRRISDEHRRAVAQLLASRNDDAPPRRTERLPEHVVQQIDRHLRRRRSRSPQLLAVALLAATVAAVCGVSLSMRQRPLAAVATPPMAAVATPPMAAVATPPLTAVATPPLTAVATPVVAPNSISAPEPPLPRPAKTPRHAVVDEGDSPTTSHQRAYISVRSNGSDTLYVHIDRTYVGTAPVSYSVDPGNHPVMIESFEGGVPSVRVAKSVRVSAGQTAIVETR